MSNLEAAKGKCSFCSSEREVVANATGASICHPCVYATLVGLERIPFSSIYCFSCKKYIEFTVHRQTSIAAFRFQSVDKYGAALYSMVACTGDYHMNAPITKIVCNSCGKNIPPWMGLSNGSVTP